VTGVDGTCQKSAPDPVLARRQDGSHGYVQASCAVSSCKKALIANQRWSNSHDYVQALSDVSSREREIIVYSTSCLWNYQIALTTSVCLQACLQQVGGREGWHLTSFPFRSPIKKVEAVNENNTMAPPKCSPMFAPQCYKYALVIDTWLSCLALLSCFWDYPCVCCCRFLCLPSSCNHLNGHTDRDRGCTP